MDIAKDFGWIVKIIDSCTAETHLEYTEVIIRLFFEKHSNMDATLELTKQLEAKSREIIPISF